MDSKEIQDGNRLIAEFMGCNLNADSPTMKVWFDDEYGTLFYCEWHPDYVNGTNMVAWNFEPNKNWCQLMPVVEKIGQFKAEPEGTGITVLDISQMLQGGYRCHINYRTKFNGILSEHKSFESVMAKMIDAVYKAVIQFIRWNNQNKPIK